MSKLNYSRVNRRGRTRGLDSLLGNAERATRTTAAGSKRTRKHTTHPFQEYLTDRTAKFGYDRKRRVATQQDAQRARNVK